MNEPLFIGIDIGTQGTKTVLCDRTGSVCGEAFQPSRLIRPASDTVYEEPDDIFSSVIATIRQVLQKTGTDGKRVAAIGIDAQMAGIMGVGKQFSASTPLDSWLDNRCAPYTEELKKRAGDAAIEKSGGQIINAHAPKILWWKNEQPDAYRKTEKFVMPNGYVAGKLCGLSSDAAFIDYTFLHFNNFTDNRNLCYNTALLAEFGVDEAKMPRIVSPETVIGTVTAEYAAACGLGSGVKVIAGCGDTAASSLGAGITASGLAYDVAGTASVFACCTDRFVPDTVHKTILFSRSVCEGLFLPLAYISGGGMCLAWFSSLTGKSLKELDAAAETVPVGSRGVTFLPHFSGRTCPLDNRVSGAFLGLSDNADAGTLFRAILESIAFEYKSYLDILQKAGCIDRPQSVRGVGGGAKSRVFSGIKADVLNTEYMALKNADSAPAAMAMLAAHATGHRTEPLGELFGGTAESAMLCKPDPTRHKAEQPYAQNYLRLLNGYAEYLTR